MPTNAEQFIQKWGKLQVTELASYQAHFNDLCELVGHPKPYALDGPPANDFRFEAPVLKSTGQKGRADAFYRGKFILEYKGAHADLDAAYRQLLLYREDLGNPPLLIVSDTRRIIIHTNFTNTITERHEITLDNLAAPDNLRKLRTAFGHVDDIRALFEPTRTQAEVTKATAAVFLDVADELKKWHGDALPPERLAHFLVRLLFCLFAEDMKLLSEEVFSNLLANARRYPDRFGGMLKSLFETMRHGGLYGSTPIPTFNGTLFDDAFVPALPGGLAERLIAAARQDWSGIDPSIFGTLFERIIDPDKRAQLGAHYTDRRDIDLIVEPVLMQPLRRQWDDLRRDIERALRREQRDKALALLDDFAATIAATTVLDPACGSGNFLYMALRALLSLQKEVIVYAKRAELGDIALSVSPAQLHGIEINPYAHELAQVVIWIGYIQWRKENGFDHFSEPILLPLDQIRRMDAILAYDADGRPVEPAWPAADVIVGNPPFLGGNKIRQELGDSYVNALFALYDGRIPAFADLVCYWFEKARAAIATDQAVRAGLLATNSIRGGANRVVLDRIKTTGNIFFAYSDRPWLLEGAAVRVSVVGFDNGKIHSRILDEQIVSHINSDLTATVDITAALWLAENIGLSYQGPSPKGRFDISASTAQAFILSNPENKIVVRPVVSAIDIVRRSRELWTIDFAQMTEPDASQFSAPFEYVVREVKPIRVNNRRAAYAEKWWQYAEARPGMRQALSNIPRYLSTPRVAKHRVFVWLSREVLSNDGTIVIARSDDYFFGVLHARPHELWALRLGSSLGPTPRYTSSSTFETYPFPWPPGQEPAAPDGDSDYDYDSDYGLVADIADAARALDAFRNAWLYPPAAEIGVTLSASVLKKRTLTNMYNALAHYRAARAAGTLHTLDFKTGWKQAAGSDFTLEQAQQLHDIHSELDHAVLRAYGWPPDLSDEQLLARLLALNLQRAAAQGDAPPPAPAADADDDDEA